MSRTADKVTPATTGQKLKIEGFRTKYGLKIDTPEGMTKAEASKIISDILGAVIADNIPLEILVALQKGYAAMVKTEADEEPARGLYLTVYDAPRSFSIPDVKKEGGIAVREKHVADSELRNIYVTPVKPVLPEGTSRSQEEAFFKAVIAHLSRFRWKYEDDAGNEGFAVRLPA